MNAWPANMSMAWASFYNMSNIIEYMDTLSGRAHVVDILAERENKMKVIRPVHFGRQKDIEKTANWDIGD